MLCLTFSNRFVGVGIRVFAKFTVQIFVYVLHIDSTVTVFAAVVTTHGCTLRGWMTAQTVS